MYSTKYLGDLRQSALQNKESGIKCDLHFIYKNYRMTFLKKYQSCPEWLCELKKGLKYFFQKINKIFSLAPADGKQKS